MRSSNADEELYVVETLNKYLEITERRREGKIQLSLNFKKIFKAIVSSTVSGWIKKILELAKINIRININPTVFDGLSTRSVTTSKEHLQSLSLSEIFDRG